MFRDPLKPDAGRHVRYEEIAGVGDEAIAVVEPADASKGFIQGGEALQSFAALGAAVADRLK